MESSTLVPQKVLLVGASSEIAGALVAKWLDAGTMEFVLTGRDQAALRDIISAIEQRGGRARWQVLDAEDPTSIAPAIEAAWNDGDIDVAVIAIGVLLPQLELEEDPAGAWQVLTVNATASVVIALEVAKRMRAQRHGTLVLLSSVAGLRGRRDNFVYGSSKAALDVFGEGLRQAVEGEGVHVVVVRPGFVRSRMSSGIKPAPFSVSTEASAAAITRGVATGRPVIWVPPILAPIFWVLRLLPHAMWRVIVNRVRPS